MRFFTEAAWMADVVMKSRMYLFVYCQAQSKFKSQPIWTDFNLNPDYFYPHQISSGAARIVSNCVKLNIFMFWDGCTLNHFVIYHFDEKYQCLLISYKLILFQQK